MDDRTEAVGMCNLMIERGLLAHARDKDEASSKKRPFVDGGDLFRFSDDTGPASRISDQAAGNGDMTHTGKLGCKFSFAPHTCHNSLILDLSLAEEIESAVAQGDMATRKITFEKLRARVKECVTQGAAGWDLTQSITVSDVPMNVFSKQRPWGIQNTRMDGTLAESPQTFVSNILRFSQRSKWESNFDDGVSVESIDLEGEHDSLIGLTEAQVTARIAARVRAADGGGGGKGNGGGYGGSSSKGRVGSGGAVGHQTVLYDSIPDP